MKDKRLLPLLLISFSFFFQQGIGDISPKAKTPAQMAGVPA